MSTNNKTKPAGWKASAERELKRLKPDEEDWSLPGTGGATATPSSRTRGKSSSDDMSDITSMTSPSKPAAGGGAVLFGGSKPPRPSGGSVALRNIEGVPAERGIMELYKLKVLMERTCVCQLCGSKNITVTFPTNCIATHTIVTCNECVWEDGRADKPAPATTIQLDLNPTPSLDSKERNTDFAINVQFVLCHLAGGDGGREAGRLLGFLGLPKSTSMGRRAFTDIETRIGIVIRAVTREIVINNLINECKATMEKDGTYDEALFNTWKEAVKSGNGSVHGISPNINTSGDMGWQKKGSGHTYNSVSGHAFYAGVLLRMPVAMCVLSKECNRCFYGAPHTEEACPKNFDGSSKAMEPEAMLRMYVDMYNKYNVRLNALISDDDSSIKAKLRWSNEDYFTHHGEHPTIISATTGKETRRPNKGRLPYPMQQPIFLADPNHRKKTLKKYLYELLKKKVADRHGVTKCDVIRLGKNFAYMMRTLKYRDESEYVDAGKAVVEHHFDCHDFCGDWCKRSKQTAEQRLQSKKYYRCKTKDGKLYSALNNIIARFITLEALKEIGHGGDTQVNESLNNTISWLAPKNKTYGKSMSLTNRISIAIGVHSLGPMDYWRLLFNKLGMAVNEDTLYYLSSIDSTRAAKNARAKMNDYKAVRMKVEHDNLQKHTEVAKKERAERDGVAYESGVGMTGGYTAEEIDNAATDDSKKKKKKRCSSCQGTSHLRVTSRMCPNNAAWLAG